MKSINPLLYSFDDSCLVDTSTNVKAAKYCSLTNTLTVKFSGDGVYLYSALPPSVYRDFCRADSKGRFISKKIRGAYPYIKLPTS